MVILPEKFEREQEKKKNKIPKVIFSHPGKLTNIFSFIFESCNHKTINLWRKLKNMYRKIYL
jgi:hypothetical protein